MPEPTKIAIAGGGISGLSLAYGLSSNPNLSISVYEATAKFLDIGGGIALHGNGLRALESIHPALSEAYFSAATLLSERDVEMATRITVGEGQRKGEVLAEIGKAKGRKTVARSDFLEALLATLPEGMVRFQKRLMGIKESAGGIELSFKDGSTVTTDVLIGCDGVWSATRRYLLGDDHPALLPKNHDGWIAVRRNVPVEEVMALNPSLMDFVPIYCGHRGIINCMPLHFGKTLSVTFGTAPKDEATLEERSKGVSEGWAAEEPGMKKKADPVLAEDFADWSQDARDIVELGMRDPITDWKVKDHDPAPFYTKNNIVMVGDAAHATMPFAGQGAGQSLEDGAVLTALFKHVKTIGDVKHAFAAYDAVRRPRSQRIAEQSREYGRIYAFLQPGIGDDLDKIRKRMYEGEMYASGVDLDKQNQDAVDLFLKAIA